MRDLACIVPIYRGADFVTGSIGSLLEHTSRRFELVPVFDGGGVAEEGIIETLVEERGAACDLYPIRTLRRLGFPRAVNCGFHAVGPQVRYVALLNQDIVVWRDWDKHLIAVMDALPDVACVGPLIGGQGSPIQPGQFVPSTADIDPTAVGNLAEINTELLRVCGQSIGFVPQRLLAFCCVVFRASALKKIGLLDDALSDRRKTEAGKPPGRWGLGEDDDWGYRARTHPERFVLGLCKKAFVWHRWGCCFDDEIRRQTAKLRLPYLAQKFGLEKFVHPALTSRELAYGEDA